MTSPKNLNIARKPGEIFADKYKITRTMRGGMSRIYFVEDIHTREEWVMKEYMKSGIDKKDRLLKQGMIAETKTLMKLRHPSIPYVVDAYELPDSFVLIEEEVEGTTLRKILYEGPQLPESVRNWTVQLCDVLHYLHTRKPPLIYRDIKPANIMLKDGVIYLIDFGTVKEKVSREDAYKAFTKEYAAPEQLKKESDERSDIYEIGVTMDQLLTGKLHQGQSLRESVENLQRTCTMKGLVYIVRKCLEPNPEDRIQSVSELKKALIHYKEFEPEYQKRDKLKRVMFYLSFLLPVIPAVLLGLKLSEEKLTIMQSFGSFNIWMIILLLILAAGIPLILYFVLGVRKSREAKAFTDSIENRKSEPPDYTELIFSAEEDEEETDEEATALTSEEFQSYIGDKDFSVVKSLKITSQEN